MGPEGGERETAEDLARGSHQDLATAAPQAGAVAALRSIGRALLRIPFPLSVLPVCAWAWLIWSLSSRSAVDAGDLVASLPLIGNLAHAFEFGILALFAVLLLPRRAGWPRLSAPFALTVFLVLAGCAWLDEWNQSRVPDRNASLFDVATDAVGVACVLAVIAYLGRAKADGMGLRRRLLVATLACVAAAAAATLYQGEYGAGPWPFPYDRP